MREEVVVIGCGVIGLSTAITLAESGHRVRVLTRDPPLRTTSALAGALWEPYRAEPQHLVRAWAQRTFPVLEELARTPDETGVRMVEGVKVHQAADLPLPEWAETLPNVTAPATPSDLPPGYCSGYRARLPLLDMPTYLTYLARRFASLGGLVEQRSLTTLTDIAGDVPFVVNCTGLGARDLVGDRLLVPVRGQLVVVENPGVREWFIEAQPAATSRGLYLFPQPDTVILGGTAEDNQWDTHPDTRTAQEIIQRCSRIHPALASANVVAHRVGLRPYRPTIRLEREVLPSGTICVHNYGHGGSGVTLSWACAADAATLLTPG